MGESFQRTGNVPVAVFPLQFICKIKSEILTNYIHDLQVFIVFFVFVVKNCLLIFSLCLLAKNIPSLQASYLKAAILL